jgi:acyl-CoA oxidase
MLSFFFFISQLIQNASTKLLENLGNSPDPFSAWNSSQVFFLVDAAKAFGELWILNENVSAEGKCNEVPTKTVLDRLIKLWAISVIVEDLATFRENDYISSEQGKFLKSLVLDLSSQLKNEVIGIIDALAPPDAILGSPIGASDGDVKNI